MEELKYPKVGRLDFASFWSPLDKSKLDIKRSMSRGCEEIKYYSKKTGKLLCMQRGWPFDKEKQMEYYIMEDPDPDEVTENNYRYIELTTPQQVQKVYDVLHEKGLI